MTPLSALEGHTLTRLTVLDLGLFDVGPGKRTIGIQGFLLETDRGAKILFDTGFDAGYAQDYAALDARDGLSGFGRLIAFTARQTLTGQLALMGLTPADLTLAVLSHAHIDHVGGLPLLSCPILLTKTERAEPRPIYWGDARPLAWPDLPYIEITTDTLICTGLTALPTPGHTPGHLSLLAHLPSGPVILAADAINRASEPAEGYADAVDPTAAATSGNRLLALQAELGATLIMGHDPAQWATLPKAPHPLP